MNKNELRVVHRDDIPQGGFAGIVEHGRYILTGHSNFHCTK